MGESESEHWPIVVAAFFTQALTHGFTGAMGVFYVEWKKAFADSSGGSAAIGWLATSILGVLLSCGKDLHNQILMLFLYSGFFLLKCSYIFESQLMLPQSMQGDCLGVIMVISQFAFVSNLPNNDSDWSVSNYSVKHDRHAAPCTTPQRATHCTALLESPTRCLFISHIWAPSQGPCENQRTFMESV